MRIIEAILDFYSNIFKTILVLILVLVTYFGGKALLKNIHDYDLEYPSNKQTMQIENQNK